MEQIGRRSRDRDNVFLGEGTCFFFFSRDASSNEISWTKKKETTNTFLSDREYHYFAQYINIAEHVNFVDFSRIIPRRFLETLLFCSREWSAVAESRGYCLRLLVIASNLGVEARRGSTTIEKRNGVRGSLDGPSTGRARVVLTRAIDPGKMSPDIY